MNDHILCAIDFTESSVHALKWAYKLAQHGDSQLVVLHSYRLLETGNLKDIVSFRKNKEIESRQKFDEMDKIARSGNVKSSFVTEIGFSSDIIHNFIRKKPSTLVVLSETMAYSIYDHKGETLLQFLKTLHVPLLIVPDKERNPQAVFEAEVSKRKLAS